MNDIAENLIFEGFNVIPVLQDKRPAVKWKDYITEPVNIADIQQQIATSFGIAVICGGVSGGLECIDFDAHEKDIYEVFNKWSNEEGVKDILERNRCYIEQSPRGGYHVFYRYEAAGKRDGNRKIANWSNGESMIETRGHGGYVIIAPTPGYIMLRSDLVDIQQMTIDERDYLLKIAAEFNQQPQPQQQQGTVVKSAKEVVGFDNTDVVSWYNWTKLSHAKQLLIDKGWQFVETDKHGQEYWRRPGKDTGTSATWGYKNSLFYVFSTSVQDFKPYCFYSPFQIFVKLEHGGDYMAAIHALNNQAGNPKFAELPFIKVFDKYYKRFVVKNRYNEKVEFKPYDKNEIKQEAKRYGQSKETIFDKIPAFDSFCIVPSYTNHREYIGNLYNLFSKLPHDPKEGSTIWSDRLMTHVFGDQIELGYRYMQILYQHPDKQLPILTLVSEQRSTGKTTFVNWIQMIFDQNAVNIRPEDLNNSHNGAYATANIICIEETSREKFETIEKLKAITTAKTVTVNPKYVNPYNLDFFGKIILTSNHEDKFARVDDKEIRFFVRKLSTPEFKDYANFEDLLRAEIPAFLYKLSQRSEIDFSVSRNAFTPDELNNEFLQKVKERSKSYVYHEIKEQLTELFLENDYNYLFATAGDLKKHLFEKNNNISAHYIAEVIRKEFGIESKNQYYNVMNGLAKKNGRAFHFDRALLGISEESTGDNIPF